MNDEQIFDRQTKIFYGALLSLVILDLILLFWILYPFNHFVTPAYASQKVPVVSDAGKPSPFDAGIAKIQPVQGARRKPAVRRGQP